MKADHFTPPDHWDWPIDLPYSAGVRSGELVFVGGEAALDKNGNVLFPNDVVSQTRLVMDNIAAVLAGFGATLADVVKITTFYVSRGSKEEWMESARIRGGYFNAPGPAATAIPLPALAYDGLMIEIEVIAAAPVGNRQDAE